MSNRKSHRRVQIRPYPCALIPAFLLALPEVATAQTPSGWLIHDMQRPRPPIVEPVLDSTPVPTDARVLFDGTDLSQWRSPEGGASRWVVRDGYMESVPDSGYLYTADSFGDVQLHLEWAAPAMPSGVGQSRGNSGVFLMSRYELQVLDSYENDTYPDGQAAAIYGQFPPLVNVCLPPGEWQTYDIVFRRPRFDANGKLTAPARMTVLHNGVLVHDNRELWGPTSWLKFRPYEPHPDRLPLGLQDHGNPVRYRNIWLRELREPNPPTNTEQRIRPVRSIAEADFEQYLGGYVLEDGTPAEILHNGKSISLQVMGRERIALVPNAEQSFLMRWTDGKLDFKTTEEQGTTSDKAEIDGFTMHLGGRTYTATRRNSGSE